MPKDGKSTAVKKIIPQLFGFFNKFILERRKKETFTKKAIHFVQNVKIFSGSRAFYLL